MNARTAVLKEKLVNIGDTFSGSILRDLEAMKKVPTCVLINAYRIL